MFWYKLDFGVSDDECQWSCKGHSHRGNDKLISPIMKQFDPTKDHPELLELSGSFNFKLRVCTTVTCT